MSIEYQLSNAHSRRQATKEKSWQSQTSTLSSKLRNKGIESHTTNELLSPSMETDQSKTDEIIQQGEQTIMTTVDEIIFYPPKTITRKKKKNHKKKKVNEKQTVIKKKKDSFTTSMSTKKVKTTTTITNDSVDYYDVPDEVFLQILSTAFNGAEMLTYFADDDDKIKFTRHYTSLTDRLSNVRLQELQWKYYHHLGMTQNIWSGRMSKRMAEKFSICHTYGRSKAFIEQHFHQIEQHLQQANHALEQFE